MYSVASRVRDVTASRAERNSAPPSPSLPLQVDRLPLLRERVAEPSGQGVGRPEGQRPLAGDEPGDQTRAELGPAVVIPDREVGQPARLHRVAELVGDRGQV